MPKFTWIRFFTSLMVIGLIINPLGMLKFLAGLAFILSPVLLPAMFEGRQPD